MYVYVCHLTLISRLLSLNTAHCKLAQWGEATVALLGYKYVCICMSSHLDIWFSVTQHRTPQTSSMGHDTVALLGYKYVYIYIYMLSHLDIWSSVTQHRTLQTSSMGRGHCGVTGVQIQDDRLPGMACIAQYRVSTHTCDVIQCNLHNPRNKHDMGEIWKGILWV